MWQVKLHYIVVGFTRLALPLDLTMWSHTVTLLGLLTLATLLSTASELHYKQPSWSHQNTYNTCDCDSHKCYYTCQELYYTGAHSCNTNLCTYIHHGHKYGRHT